MSPGFDPSAGDQRATELARRLAHAVRRMGDTPDAAVVRALTEGAATELFEQFLSLDPNVVVAAHECAMLRYAYIVAIVAQNYRFDGYERDDLVQRVFLDLPGVVRRSRDAGNAIPNPEGWIHQRAQLMARQSLREEQGTAVIDIETGLARRDAEGRLVRTRGFRVGMEAIDQHVSSDRADELVEKAIEQASLRDGLRRALADLAREQPVGAEILRMQLNEGVQLPDVATRLGRTHGTVRNDAMKARRRLATIIRERYPELLPDGAADGEQNDAIA